MNKVLSILFFLLYTTSYAQTTRLWTEQDRKYLLDNLERTKTEIIAETKNLTLAQWAFKETPDKWSIGQVLEHLGLYERIFEQEADIMLSSKPEPELNATAKPDSVYLSWMGDPNPHKAERNAEPLGLMKGEDNLKFFLFGRENIIQFVKGTTYDLKAHYTFRWGDEKRRSIHALMVVHFGHTDRHLRQIQKIKNNPGFPK
ncbi:DinB family protein [Emticicia agri]|uniref:DinB family protein n=1 Tax=Emticicia agri TaxID=2492393 RepID=A0A4Q5M0D9_9BACT|nr:DinB family protein [Emticicia agri]RYU95263.1 DinB family protein [Emticicia agri]